MFPLKDLTNLIITGIKRNILFFTTEDTEKQLELFFSVLSVVIDLYTLRFRKRFGISKIDIPRQYFVDLTFYTPDMESAPVIWTQ